LGVLHGDIALIASHHPLEALAEALAVALLPLESKSHPNYPLLFLGFLLVGFEALADPYLLPFLMGFEAWALALGLEVFFLLCRRLD
tara:strand:+ start:125 stop:385 length:261 start_codon:yes stop_codon:yes gene_type:complete